MKKFNGDINNPLFKHKILIVSALYYKNVVNNLVKQAKEELFNCIQSDEIMEISEVFVDGAFEIPFVINHRLDYFDGFVALGCIIRGKTYHFELIANEVARKIMDISISSNKPIGFGIIACDNMDQAIERSRLDEKNKGTEAARACYRLLSQKTISDDSLEKSSNI